MPDHFLLNISANIRILNKLRLIAIIGQVALILFATYYLEILLPLNWLFGLITLEILFQCYCVSQLQQKTRATSWNVLLPIAFDSLLLAALIYFSGGANNPFTYLLLLPIALAAQMLNLRELIIVVGLELLLYSLLNLYQRPLTLGESSPLASFHLHLMGMWVNFILTVILIAVFGFLTRHSMSNKEKQIQALREIQLKDEQLLSLGIMSASAAHELGTPLATMAIIVEDLKHQSLPKKVGKDLDIVVNQIQACRRILRSIKNKSYHAQKQLTHQKNEWANATLKNLRQYLQRTINNWLVYRPQITLNQIWEKELECIHGQLPISVEQAITNLLNNAADASAANNRNKITIHCFLNLIDLVIEIQDYGQGISQKLKQSLGSCIQESKNQDGLGWGVFLSNASIERAGGKVQLLTAGTGGTLTKITLPREAII